MDNVYKDAHDQMKLNYSILQHKSESKDQQIKALEQELTKMTTANEQLSECYVFEKVTAKRLIKENDNLKAELAKHEWHDKYFELIMEVGNAYQDESRHETALRYIREAEQGSDELCCENPPQPEKGGRDES